MQTYLNQLHHILENGHRKADRTGVGTISSFGLQARYAMANGFPAVTTKKLAFKVMASELLWFISGSDNINDLKAIYPHNKIWDANYQDYFDRTLDRKLDKALDKVLNKELDRAQDEPSRKVRGDEDNVTNGEMGRIYGTQWRHWRTADGREIDQLQEAIKLIKHNPASRRIIVNAWNPGEADPSQVALPPCHAFFQFYVVEGRLSLHMYQRSADMFLGVPFNIASYALLLHLVARITGLEPDEFVHSIGDAHIYLDAVEQVRQQLRREPLPLPSLTIKDRRQATIDDFRMDDFLLKDYQYHDAIKADMAV